MKFLHLADLHIGKKVNGFSMLEDQAYILRQVLEIIDKTQPDGVLLAGDIYDKGIPTVEGVCLLDDFLTRLHERHVDVFFISGNHDSPQRLDFGGRIMEHDHIYISTGYAGSLKKIQLTDEYGKLNIYLLPFLKPGMAAKYDSQVTDYESAIASVLQREKICIEDRNILVAHQFITNNGELPLQSDSESITVGNMVNVDVSVFQMFDYVALGHLHRAQKIGRDTVRYAGSLLKYSFSEAKHEKSLTLITFKEKGNISVELIPLHPQKDLREIKGKLGELIECPAGNQEDYIRATLTDEEELFDALGKLRAVYPNIMRLDFENARTLCAVENAHAAKDVEEKTGLQLFEEFFSLQNGTNMTDEQLKIMKEIFEEGEIGNL